MALLLQIITAALLLLCAGLVLRSIRRVSVFVAVLAATVAVARLAIGVAMYVISKWDLPLFTGLHAGDGYWTIGQDSATYYELARIGLTDGLWAIPGGSPSPSYTRALALWMGLIGASPVAALAFNASVYLLMVWALVRVWRAHAPRVPERGLVLSIAALSLSPSLTISATQILKDVYFAALLAVFVAAACVLLPEVRALLRTARASPALLAGLTGVLTIILMVSGVRAYFGPFLILGLGAALVGWTVMRPLRWVAPRIAAVLVMASAAWIAFAVGAGAYYAPYGRIVDGVAGRAYDMVGLPQPSWLVSTTTPSSEARDAAALAPSTVVRSLDSARRGFVASGGRSNLGAQTLAQEMAEIRIAGGVRLEDRLHAVAIGLAVTFVPLSVLQVLGLVDVDIGRTRMLLADVDTAFNVLILVLLATWMWSLRREVTFDWPLCALLLCTATISLVLVAYVVTNVGTLVRLRVPGMVMLWLLPLAVRDRRAVERTMGEDGSRSALMAERRPA